MLRKETFSVFTGSNDGLHCDLKVESCSRPLLRFQFHGGECSDHDSKPAGFCERLGAAFAWVLGLV